MSELDIEDRWTEVLEAGREYERWFIVSDDAVPRRFPLAVVQHLLDDHPVVTGYSNLSRDDMRVNLSPDRLVKDRPGLPLSYGLLDFESVMTSRSEVFKTTLVGFSLTGMSREMWERFPFQAYGRPGHATGFSSDYSLSKRLQDAGVPIVAAREAFVYHLKEVWNQHDLEPRKRLLVGVEPPSIELEVVP